MTEVPQRNYAYLPEELLMQILENTSESAKRLATILNVNQEQVVRARSILADEYLIKSCSTEEFTTSIMAADGANIVEHKTSADVLMAIAVGVDGLSDRESEYWPAAEKQFQQWQTVLPHHVANPRLAQGIMFLMELTILSGCDRKV